MLPKENRSNKSLPKAPPEPKIIDPNKEETKFANLPVQETGSWKANVDRWVAVDDLAKSLGMRDSEQMRGVRGGAAVADANVERAKKRLDEANGKIAEWSSRLARPVQSYPSIARAMVEVPDLTEADVRRIVNFAAAWTAADAIRATENVNSQMNILLSLPEAERFAVMDIMEEQDRIKREGDRDVARQAEEAARERSTYGMPRLVAQGIGSEVVGSVFGAAEQLYSGTQQALRAGLYGKQQRGGPAINITDYNPLDVFFYWSDVEKGKTNPKVIEEAKAEYGSVAVDLILEIKDLQESGDPSPIATVSAKYYGDPERATIINSLTQRVWDDPQRQAEADRILSLADKLDTASLSDLGAMITTTNPLTGEPIPVDSWWRGSMPQQAASKISNIVASYVADPLLFGNKIRGVYLAAKYGLDRIAVDAGEQVTRDALHLPAVQTYLKGMTDDIAKYADMRAAGEDVSNFGQVIARRYARYFPEDVLFDAAKYGVKTPDDFVQYVVDSNAALKIERGEAFSAVDDLTQAQKNRIVADIEDKSVFGRMARQQYAKRGQTLLPRGSLLGSEVRRTVVNATSKLKPDTQAKQQIRAFYEDANNPDLSAGAILNTDVKAVVALDNEANNAWDSIARLLSTTAGKNVIYTADARDTQVFRRFARIFLSKQHSDFLADKWRNGSQADRILMWVGIVRTAAEKRGASEIPDRVIHLGSKVINNKNSMTVKELTEALEFADNPKNLFSPESIAVKTVNGVEVDVDDWAKEQVDNFVKAQTEATGVAPSRLEIDAFKFGLITSNPQKRATINAAVSSSPSDFNGRQLPLHLYQTSDYLSIPSLSDIALITKRAKLTNQLLGLTPNSVGSEVVNWWSMLNLAGFRYSTRNAIEDYTMYALTGGYFMDIVKGRATSTGVRETRGQNIGWFARKMRRAAGTRSPEEPWSLWDNIILGKLDPDDVAKAQKAAAEGDLNTLRNLTVFSVVSQKIGKALDKDEIRWISEYVASDASFNQLDEISELARHLNLGTYPGAPTTSYGVAAIDGSVAYPRSDYASIKMSGTNPLRFGYWHMSIEGIAKRDGSIGRAALINLDDQEAAVNAVREAIEADTKYKYRERLAAFYEENVSTEEFARRYVQDVRNTFSRRDGSLNTKLWRRIVTDVNGKRVVRMPTGTQRLTVEELSRFNKDDMPKYVLGKELTDQPIVIPTSISEKIWNMMGNAMARISKEPIYFANYLRSRRGLMPYEQNLAEAVGPEAAGYAASRIALDRAMNLTLQFTDNPANQSMLAWRMRNFARYYRATEDFYRRMYRAAKYEPISYYKAWLALNILDQTGFVYRDRTYDDPNAPDTLNKLRGMYFLYPGDGVVNNLMGTLLSMGGNQYDGIFTNSTPLTFGGKVSMAAPSFDPNSSVPMLGSPLAAISVKTFTAIFPMFEEYEKYALGIYAADKPAIEASLPAPISKILSMMNQEERGSAYVSAGISAAKVVAGAGLMPDRDADPTEWGRAIEGIRGIADQVLKLRFALGFIYAASPQVMENNVTSFAREMGVSGMSSVYRQLVQKEMEAGSPDPYGTALIKGVSIYGLGFTAYQVPKADSPGDMKSLPEYAYNEQMSKFLKDNGSLINDHPDAAMFLAPQQDGTYDASARKKLIDMGYRESPDLGSFLDRLALAEAYYVYNVTMDDADAYIANAPTDAERKRREEVKRQDKVRVFAQFPSLRQEMAGGKAEKVGNADLLLNGQRDENGVPLSGKAPIRKMIDDFYSGKYGPVPASVKYIAEAVSTYDYFVSDSKSYTGNTKAARESRKANRLNLLKNLRAIAADDPNAEMFIRRVMYPLLSATPEGEPRD